MARDQFITLRADGKVTVYSYFEVESVVRKPSKNLTQFSFQLNFYAKEYGAKRKSLTFVCDEDLSNASQEETKSSETKEFAFIHTFQRMLPMFWQKFFEEKLEIKGLSPDGTEDCYQFHAFVLKKNKFFMT